MLITIKKQNISKTRFEIETGLSAVLSVRFINSAESFTGLVRVVDNGSNCLLISSSVK